MTASLPTLHTLSTLMLWSVGEGLFTLPFPAETLRRPMPRSHSPLVQVSAGSNGGVYYVLSSSADNPTLDSLLHPRGQRKRTPVPVWCFCCCCGSSLCFPVVIVAVGVTLEMTWACACQHVGDRHTMERPKVFFSSAFDSSSPPGLHNSQKNCEIAVGRNRL